MKSQNVVDQTKERIETLVNNKEKELDKIKCEIKAARTKKEAAEIAVKDATEKTDIAAYEKAKEEKRAANTAIEMYTARYNMLENKDFVTEEDSDNTIAAILAYEKEQEKAFVNSIQEPIKQLKELVINHRANIEEAEDTLKKWTSTIHANYKNGCTVYSDGTNRSVNPVPVRYTLYDGSPAAGIIDNTLEKLKEYIEE